MLYDVDLFKVYIEREEVKVVVDKKWKEMEVIKVKV